VARDFTRTRFRLEDDGHGAWTTLPVNAEGESAGGTAMHYDQARRSASRPVHVSIWMVDSPAQAPLVVTPTT
jgi:hypothetical protein